MRATLSVQLLSAGLLAVAACAPRDVPPPAVGAYVGGPVAIECAPFARALSGVQLNGDAADWWTKAEGRYERRPAAAIGGVLVFRPTTRLPAGHVAVVSDIRSDREILVTHANWVRHRVTADMPVIDVSPGNDWTAVRVWWPPAGQMGVTEYPTFGFIVASRPRSRDRLLAETPQAVRVAAAP